MFVIATLVCVLALFYFTLIKPFQYWKKKELPQASIVSLWWDIITQLLQLKSQTDVIRSVYDSFKGQRYGGSYQFLKPTLYLRDPDLIKQITVKDFDHFVDRNQFLSEEDEPLWAKNLLALKGDRWRDMRATLSPSFTGSKMRALFGLVMECSEQFVRHFENDDSEIIVVEFQDVFSRYANDVIGSIAFGVSCDSLQERDNEFYIMGRKASTFKGLVNNIKLTLMAFAPKLAAVLGVRLFDRKASAFFRNLVKTSIETRKRHGIVRPDMIHLLMKAQEERLSHVTQKPPLSHDDITAQAVVFFFAGFQTASTAISFTMYELAVNPDVQQRLQEEIEETSRACQGKLSYDALLKMKYLDMVLTESLRKWPPAITGDRVCVKPYVIQPRNPNEVPLHLKEGDSIMLPIVGLQRDTDHFPDPDRFDPERFNDENRPKIHPYAYIPFGAGPRLCIGNRFGLLECKAAIFAILSKFDVVVVERSQVPIRLSKKQFHINAENGFWFGFKRRPTATNL